MSHHHTPRTGPVRRDGGSNPVPAAAVRCRRRSQRIPATIGTLGLAVVAASGSDRALAVNADEYLFIPLVTQGERELDFHFGTASGGPQTASQSNAGISIGTGVTQHWFTALDIEYQQQPASGTRLDALEWENILQFGEPGEWPVDVGMVFNVERAQNSFEGWTARFGPLLQKEFGRIEANLNLLAGRRWESSLPTTNLFGYQGQVKFRYSEPLEIGVQSFGRFSGGGQNWAPWPNQVQRVGPVVLGRLKQPRERSLTYNFAVLFGTTARSPDTTVRLQFEYEF